MPDMMTFVQRQLDKTLPNPDTQKYVWFILLWFTGLIGVAILAYALRSILFLAQ